MSEFNELEAMATRKKEDAVVKFQMLCSSLVMVVVTVALNGWVLTILWRWFVMPIFPVPVINMAQGIGLVIVGRYMLGSSRVSLKDDDGLAPVPRILIRLVFPFGILAVGWVVHQYV